MIVVWCVWIEWNSRVFKDLYLLGQLLWDRIVFLASLWCTALGSFCGVPRLEQMNKFSSFSGCE